jgi:hypothetical protein
MKRPSNLSEGFAERYRIENFETITNHELNLHLDIDCLCVRNIHALFNQLKTTENTFYIMTEDGNLFDDNHGGLLLEKGILSEGFPGISAGWYAWKHSEGQREFFKTVLKGCLENMNTPYYTVDQPFYNYEIVMRIVSKKEADFSICILSKEIVVFNPYIEDESLKNAYFVNFAGEPGVQDCHYKKILEFFCMDFSTSPTSSTTPTPKLLFILTPLPLEKAQERQGKQGQQEQEQEQEQQHDLLEEALIAPQVEENSHNLQQSASAQASHRQLERDSHPLADLPNTGRVEHIHEGANNTAVASLSSSSACSYQYMPHTVRQSSL